MGKYIIDIDQTICVSLNSNYTAAIPLEDRIKHINELFLNGNEIHYWTARGQRSGIDWTDFTIEQLRSWGCLFSSLTLGKPSYDFWVDDKAFNSEDWFKTKNTVFINGVFDLLHKEHLKMIEFASKFGDHLVIAIDSDARVKKLKGKDRPINNQEERKYILSRIKGVKEVHIFNSAVELTNIIRKLSPCTMVKGIEYKNKKIVGGKFCDKIIFYEGNNEYSTTKKIQDIINRRIVY